MPFRVVHALLQTAHGNLDFDDLVKGSRGVTGSEQAMLYLAKAQADKKHDVVCYLPCEKPGFSRGVELIDIKSAWPRLRRMDRTDVVIAWLSSDTLHNVHPRILRIHSLQINDWLMNAPGFDQFVDVYVAVSKAHKQHLSTQIGYPEDESKWEILPNGVDCSRFVGNPERIPLRCVYLSSPDRGLHWLLSMWQQIRFAFPTAELHVFYETKAWMEAACAMNNEVGVRAEYIRQTVPKLEKHGVIMRDAVSPAFLAEELLKADIMLYPTDSVSFTEGFGVAVLEAIAAGVLPVITDCDAFGELYGDSGAVVVPRGNDRTWVDRYLETVLEVLQKPRTDEMRAALQQWARRYDWSIVAGMWDAMIERRRKA